LKTIENNFRMKVEHVFAQVRAPANGDQGVMVEGCFILDGNKVVMTDREGKPIIDDDGRKWSREIPEGQSARQVAARMAKELRTKFRGGERAAGWGLPIPYEPLKLA
jgi:hypothetical protein